MCVRAQKVEKAKPPSRARTLPMLVADDMSANVRAVQPWKADCPMSVNDDMLTDVRAVQSLKACTRAPRAPATR